MSALEALMTDPHEAVAYRQRQAVRPDGGREEGALSRLLSSAAPAVGKSLLELLMFPGRYAEGQTGYLPGQMAADQPEAVKWAPDMALNLLGAPALTGGVPGIGMGLRTRRGETFEELMAGHKQQALERRNEGRSGSGKVYTDNTALNRRWGKFDSSNWYQQNKLEQRRAILAADEALDSMRNTIRPLTRDDMIDPSLF